MLSNQVSWCICSTQCNEVYTLSGCQRQVHARTQRHFSSPDPCTWLQLETSRNCSIAVPETQRLTCAQNVVGSVHTEGATPRRLCTSGSGKCIHTGEQLLLSGSRSAILCLDEHLVVGYCGLQEVPPCSLQQVAYMQSSQRVTSPAYT